jgi:2-polyprenyl-3-methyl-5-hydroxy-6-metoxy-1,4-benzoquinol methylase
LLRHAPAHLGDALDVGCGSGSFARVLASRADHVLGIDLSPRMIEIARQRSLDILNVQFRMQDVMTLNTPASFDCIASIATLHHLPLREVLIKLRDLLRPGGVLLVLDLFEGRDLIGVLTYVPATFVSASLRRQHHMELLKSREEIAAWSAHGATDVYPRLGEVRSIAAEVLPGARIKRHLLWRYSLIWKKSE